MTDERLRSQQGWVWAARRAGQISYTSTATRNEALVAAWRLATTVGDRDAIGRYSIGALRTAQLQLRAQFTDANTKLYSHPERLIGGWGANASDPVIRIDYVQHNISALTGLFALAANR